MLEDDDLIVGTKTVVRPFWRRLFVIALIAAIGGVALGFGLFINRIETKTPDHASIEQADGIVVLTGSGYRLVAGLDLFLADKADRLLFTGVDRAVTKPYLQDLLTRPDSPKAQQIFDCCVDIEHVAHDTWGNAAAAKLWAAQQGYERLIIVTSAYHMQRARLVFRDAMPDKDLIPFPIAAKSIPVNEWWKHRNVIDLLAGEFAKTSAVWFTVTWRRFVAD